MTPGTFLDAGEIRALTGKATRPAQERRLREMGIPFESGKPPIVLRSVLERRADAKAQLSNPYEGYATEPDFSVFPALV